MPALHLEKQHLLRLTVDGQDIPINLTSFIELSICSNIATILPTFKFVYRDYGNFLHTKSTLREGSMVGIVMHSAVFSDPEQPNEMVFRVMSTKIQLDGNTLRYTAVGVLDHIDYLRGISNLPETGTSSSVIAKIASSVKLKPIVDSTSDDMIWRPAKDFIASFIGQVSSHGYAGASSIMSHAVTDQSELLYKDVGALAKSKGGRSVKAISFANAKSGDIPYLTWEAKSVGGFSNYYYGYGVKIVQELLDGKANLIDSINVPMMGQALNLASDIMSAIGGVRNEYMPADATNQHKKYYEAENQNKRGAALFSNVCTFTTHQATALTLYDLVNFYPSLPTSNEISEMLAGRYIVTAKTRYLQQDTYIEKLEISNQGYGGKPGQKMVGF